MFHSRVHTDREKWLKFSGIDFTSPVDVLLLLKLHYVYIIIFIFHGRVEVIGTVPSGADILRTV